MVSSMCARFGFLIGTYLLVGQGSGCSRSAGPTYSRFGCRGTFTRSCFA